MWLVDLILWVGTYEGTDGVGACGEGFIGAGWVSAQMRVAG